MESPKLPNPFGRLWFLPLLLTLIVAGAPGAKADPAISSAHPSSTDDRTSISPFRTPNVSIASPQASVTVVVSLDLSKGSFTTLSGFSNLGGGNYSFTGDPVIATTNLRGMIFTPVENRIVPLTSELDTITIVATDSDASVTNTATVISVLSINDAPTLFNVTANRNITDKQSTFPFAGFQIADVDQFGTQHVTVSVVQDVAAKGVLSLDSSGFISSGPVSYTFDGTPSAASNALQSLSYRPTENRKPVGTNEITVFTLSVTDASGDSTANSPMQVTVTSLSVNDPPSIANVSSTHLIMQTGQTNTPFAGVVIGDVDVGDYTNETSQHVSMQVTFAGASGNGQWIPPAGYGFASGPTYTLPLGKLSDATYAIQHLVFQAQTFAITGTNTVTFKIVVTDDHAGSATNNSAAVDIYTPYTPPGLTGTRANQRVNDNATLALFSSVNIQSFNGGAMSVYIRLDHDSDGGLINLGASFVKAGSNYVFTGTSEGATAAIRQILFQPVSNVIGGGTNKTTTFFIVLVDGGVTNAPDSSTTVIVSPVNDPPSIQGISAVATITDVGNRNPFPTVSISDPDELGQQVDTVTISLDDNAKGNFTSNSLAISGFSTNISGNYTRTGTPAANTAAIQQLVFAPVPHRLPSGASENVTFTISVNDGQGGVAANSQTIIHVVAVGGGPIFNLPSPQPVSLPIAATLQPFSSSTVTDSTVITLTVQITNANWGSFTSNSLAAGGFTNAGSGSYKLTGSASNVTAAFQGLEFAPNTNVPLGTIIVFNLNAVNTVGNSTPSALAITLRLNQRSLIVTRTSDYNPNDPSVTDAQKGGTLRKAVQDAGSNDHITFDIRSGTSGVPDYPAVIRLMGNIVLNNNVVLDGPGADLLSISGDSDGSGTADQQLFEIHAQVVVNRLTLTKAHHPFAGGAIEVGPDGILRMSYCAVTDCSADVWGGAIDVDGGVLNLDHCLIKGNSTSASFGEGGGGISLYTDQRCDFVNTTFAANQQLNPGGLGGGALYAENFDAGTEFDVFVHNCTFHENTDASGHGTSIRPNVFDTEIWLQNTIVSDGQGKNLEMDDSGDVISLGGNISDDGTKTIFSIGGYPYDTTIFTQPPDFTNRSPVLLPLADNLGPTLTYALGVTSPANNSSVSNYPGATFYGSMGTDQRGFWRVDVPADRGAFEKGASQRVIIEEILFANPNNQFIEFYVPKDSTSLNLSNYTVRAHGQLFHTFSNMPLTPGQAVVVFAANAINKTVPTGVSNQVATTSLLMDTNSDTISLVNLTGQTVLQVSYVGTFVSSDPADPGYLTTPGQSIVMSPAFQGCYLPYQRVVAKEGGRTPGAGEVSSPGYDPTGTILAPGNSPPRAYSDFAATDAQTPIIAIPVLANDKDPDVTTDTIRAIGVGVTNGTQPGVTPGVTGFSHYGASLLIVSNSQDVIYDPTTSAFLTSLPQGSNVVDWFQYTILDSSNGVDNARGFSSAEISNNIVKATATVSVTVTGVNLAPTPQDDSFGTNPRLIVNEDAVLDFTTADTILANDTDPNTDDNASTLTIISIEPTATYQNSLQTVSALGAFVTLDIRFNRNQTHITYDPRGSPVLDSLAIGQTAVDTFYYSVMDRYGAIGSAAVHITVVGTNEPPQANPDTLATDEDTPLTIPFATLLANDFDPDTGITNPVPPHLIVSAVDAFSAKGASVQIVGNTVIYNPTVSSTLNALARKESVVDTFTYTALDDYGATSNAVVSITVAGRNDTPIPQPDFYSTGEKILMTIVGPGVMSNDHDPDVNGVAPDDIIRVIPFTKLSNMGAPVSMSADGSFTFDPRGVFDWLIQGQQTNDTFTYTVMDHSFSIANDDVFSVQGNSSSNVLPVLANDALLSQVGGALTITSVSVPSKAGTVAIDGTGQNLIYSPAANYVGIETLSYVVSDGFGGSDFANVTIQVTVDTLNGNLVANADSYTVAQGTTVNLNVLANDNIQPALGSVLTIVGVGTPNHGGTVSITGNGPNNVLTYSANTNNTFPLTETFTYVISGGGIARATGTVSIAVIDRSNTLTVNDDSFAVIANGSTFPIPVLANDMILPGPNTNLLITAIQTNGVDGTVAISPAGDMLLYTPPSGLNDHQEPVISYSVSDGAGGTGSGSVSVLVLSSSSTGFFANDDIFTVTKNSAGNSLSVLLNDALLPSSGQTLTITDVGLGTNAPSHGTVAINAQGTALIYTPSTEFVGLDTFTYEISYGTVVRAQGRVFVQVVNTTILPSNPNTFNVSKNSLNDTLPVLSNDYPLPKTLISLMVTGLETNGAKGFISINGTNFNNTLSYTPQSGFIGRDTFAYEFSDGQGNRGTNQVVVNVGNLLTRDDQFSVLSGSVSNMLDVLTNDAFLPDTTTVRPITGFGTPDQGGTVVANSAGTLVYYTPLPGFVGIENFTYQAKDDSGGIVTGNASVNVLKFGSDRATNTVTVTLIGTNDVPTITGTRGSFSITDKQTAVLFPNVTIGDLDAYGLQTQAVTVTFSAPRGFLSQLGGFVQTAPGVYAMTGTPAMVTTALRGLVYNPIENRIPVPTNEVTTFTISDTDFYVPSPVVESSTTLTVYSVNDPPTITGTLSNQKVYDHLTIFPFAGVTIADVDNLGQQPLTLNVTVQDPAKGYLTNLGLFVISGPGIYSLGATNPASVTAALRTLIYVPTVGNRVNPGGSETNRLVLAVNDGFAPTVTDTNTTVIATDPFIKKVASADGTTHDAFAYSVSSSRDLVVVGTPNDTGIGNTKSGSAYLYARNLGGSDAWGQLKKLVGSDSAASDLLGSAVGISGDTVIVGASNGSTNSTHTGAVYIFDRNQGGPNNWGQTKKLAPPDGSSSDQFGASVYISLDTIVIGAPLNKPGSAQTGAAYVYGRNQGGTGQWGLVKKLAPTDGAVSDFFGSAVGLSGDTIVVGSKANSPQNNNNRAGSVYVFERNLGGANQWGQSKKISAADGVNNDSLGQSVAISGDMIIAGAPFVTINNNGSGRIYLFSRNQGGTNQWGQINELLPFDGSVSSKFGWSVTIDGEIFAVGTLVDVAQSGAVYVYTRNYPGLNQWMPLQKLAPATNDLYAAFGFGISLSQNTLAVGAHFDDASNNRFAETYIYRLKFDNGPYVAKPIPDQLATPNVPFTFTIPSGTFADVDVNDSITLSLSLFPAPPVWLNFNPSTATFSGTPDNNLGTFPVVIRGTDLDGASATVSFNIIVGTGSTNGTTPLDAWRAAYFTPDVIANPALEATVWGENADPDGDGVSNIEEYVFGSNPLSADPGDASPIKIIQSSNPNTVKLFFNRRTDDWRIVYSLQSSLDMSNWQPVDPSLIVGQTTAPAGTGVEQLTQELIVTGSATQFFRVKVQFLVPE